MNEPSTSLVHLAFFSDDKLKPFCDAESTTVSIVLKRVTCPVCKEKATDVSRKKRDNGR